MSQPSTSRASSPSPDNDFACMRRIFAADIPAGAKIVLLVVLDHARYGRSKCIASNETIGRESAILPRQARRHIEALIAAGWLIRERLGQTVNHGRVLHPGPLVGIPKGGSSRTHPPGSSIAHPLGLERPTNDSPKDQFKKTGEPARPPGRRPGSPPERNRKPLPAGRGEYTPQEKAAQAARREMLLAQIEAMRAGRQPAG